MGVDENEPAVASFNGKVPAAKAEAVLQQVETLGQLRGVSIAGEDLTEQFQQQQSEIKRQDEHAEKLDKLANRSASKTALGVEEQRAQAKWGANQAKQALIGLTTRHELVTISVEFYEAQPREAMTLERFSAGTQSVLRFGLLSLTTLAVFLLIIGLVAAPIAAVRWLRRRG